MILRNDHYFIKTATTTAMRELAAPLASIGINYFSWGRHYTNGGRLWLCNSPENVINYYSNNLFRIGNTESNPANYKSQILLWSTLPNQHLYEFIKSRGINDGIFIMDPQKNYCEITAFGITKNKHQTANYFLTYLEYLKNFRDYFKETCQTLIKRGEENKLYLPYHNEIIPLDDPDISFFKNFKRHSKLSPRQYSCAKYILEGKTVNEIAQLLSLSPRTIETYINNLKIKLNCENKAELIIKLLKIF